MNERLNPVNEVRIISEEVDSDVVTNQLAGTTNSKDAVEEMQDVFVESLTEELVDFEEGKASVLHVEASVDCLSRITHFVADLAQKTGMERIEISKLKIAVYEVCMNVIEHGYRFEPGQSIGVEVIHGADRFEVTITDAGDAFDFSDVKPYDVREAFHQKRQGGYGLYIVRKSVDEVKYERTTRGENRLTLIKKIV